MTTHTVTLTEEQVMTIRMALHNEINRCKAAYARTPKYMHAQLPGLVDAANALAEQSGRATRYEIDP